MTARLDYVERARALVGCRFRPQGREPALGLDCIGVAAATFAIPAGELPRDYRLRDATNFARLTKLITRWFRPVHSRLAVYGDLLLFRISPEQLHLGIVTDLGVVHADAGLRQVVERPGIQGWPVAGAFRRRQDAPGD